MDISKIEHQVQEVIQSFSKETFIYLLLAAYGKPKASITRLQKGSLNLSKKHGQVIWKNQLFFAPANGLDLHVLADQLHKSADVLRHNLRFVVVTDWETLLAVDTKTSDTLDIAIVELPKYFDFFLPWAGHEKHAAHCENPADIKAAYKMAKLYDQICDDNPSMDVAQRHALNVFLSRLLFCFFAEDTQIFPNAGMFTSSIASHTSEDGSDLHVYLDRLFQVMNCEIRTDYPAFLQAFPYVNGGLLKEILPAPRFSKSSRKVVIECGELDWSEINPDIFGSMIQAVVHPDHRSGMGMHYTSVTNIMKVIEPLFLNELKRSFEENYDNLRGLEKLRARLSNIKVFDPACGSGNFLIIAFKELRKLEMAIYKRLRELDINYQTLFTLPQIQLTQFSGIELDDFAHEIAVLSLWLAEHQMNVKFSENLGVVVPPLPLKESGKIVCGNATRMEWSGACSKDDKSEIYLLGNPPYLGSSNQDESQKADMAIAFNGIQNYKNLDYIAAWFLKGAQYLNGSSAELAFVSTNSICQGEQVEMLWTNILDQGLEISFAHEPFHWTNSAKHNAGVTVSIIGLRNKVHKEVKKKLYSDRTFKVAENISPYLVIGRDVVVCKRSKVLSKNLPEMTYGSKPVDDGNFYFTEEEKLQLVEGFPQAEKFLKKIVGSSEFINGSYRWCIWVTASQLEAAKEIEPLKERFEKVKQFRLKSVKEATKGLAEVSYRFGEPRYVEGNSIIVPSVSSENRDYIPIGFLDPTIVISNLAFGVYGPEPWLFGLLTSRMHNIWVRTVGGRMRKDIRYSNQLCYNTFPFPEISEKQKDALTSHVLNVLSERERHPEKTMADLYAPKDTPSGLLQAHKDLDAAVDRLYRSKGYTSDDERLQYLFNLYEEMSAHA